MPTYTVRYDGLLQPVGRAFATWDRAVQWARQVGKEQAVAIDIYQQGRWVARYRLCPTIHETVKED